MKGHILNMRLALPDGAQAALETGTVVVDPTLPAPSRPAMVSAGSWRRMTRLARLLVVQAVDLHAAHPEVDWTTLPIVWGTARGEAVPCTSFLNRILVPGGGLGSPTAFQNSVYNSTPGQVSMLLGMRGLSETICAGHVSALAALHRGLTLLRDHEHVLVCVGEDLCEPTRKSWSHVDGPVGEGVISLLLARGSGIEVQWGVHDGEAPRVGRQTPMFWEAEALPPSDIVPERVCGHTMVAALGTWLLLGEGTLVETDGLTALTAWRR